MLKVFYGEIPAYPIGEFIPAPSIFFDHTYKPEWLDDPWVKAMVKDISDCEIVSHDIIHSPIFGQVPPSRLAGGIKTLILCKFNKDFVFNGSSMGDNCAKWLVDAGRDDDVVINMRHVMHFPPGKYFTAQLLNNGKVYTDADAFRQDAVDYLIDRAHINSIKEVL